MSFFLYNRQMKDMELLNSFERFFDTVKRLRAPDGCPWDIAQTPMTMRQPLLEEAYEAADAIEEHDSEKNGNTAHVREELGDVLLNVLMISYMYEQGGLFSVADVIKDVTEKLIRRHPHVFGETGGYEGPESKNKASTPETVLRQWEDIKEKVEHGAAESVFDGIPKSFPPILKTQKLIKRANKKGGFDWPDFDGVAEKIKEEISEFFEAVKTGDVKRIEDELGDVFFVMINASGFLKLDPEAALSHANKKFERRFRFVEAEMKKKGLELCKENNAEMEAFWQQAKKTETV